MDWLDKQIDEKRKKDAELMISVLKQVDLNKLTDEELDFTFTKVKEQEKYLEELK